MANWKGKHMNPVRTFSPCTLKSGKRRIVTDIYIIEDYINS